MPLPSLSKLIAEAPANEGMNRGDVLRRGRPAGADRPDRLIGDDGVRRSGRTAAASRRAGASRRQASAPSCRSRPVSPMQMIAASPARWAAAAPWRRRRHRVSPWSVRRSEWPTITALAPASASISAEMSPVWGPWRVRVAILGAEQDSRSPDRKSPRLGEQRRRRTDHESASGRGLHRQEVLQRLELGEVRARAHASSSCRRRAA